MKTIKLTSMPKDRGPEQVNGLMNNYSFIHKFLREKILVIHSSTLRLFIYSCLAASAYSRPSKEEEENQSIVCQSSGSSKESNERKVKEKTSVIHSLTLGLLMDLLVE